MEIINLNKENNKAKEIIIAWSESGGFFAVHNTGGTPENITDDLLSFLDVNGFEIIERDKRINNKKD